MTSRDWTQNFPFANQGAEEADSIRLNISWIHKCEFKVDVIANGKVELYTQSSTAEFWSKPFATI